MLHLEVSRSLGTKLIHRQSLMSNNSIFWQLRQTHATFVLVAFRS